MLAEASTELGGRIAQECRLPGLAEWGRVRDYRVQLIQTMPNVDVFLDNNLNAEDALSLGVRTHCRCNRIEMARRWLWSITTPGRVWI